MQEIKWHIQGMMVFVSFICQRFILIFESRLIRKSSKVILATENSFSAEDRKYEQKDEQTDGERRSNIRVSDFTLM
jgi:hypothetical protein